MKNLLLRVLIILLAAAGLTGVAVIAFGFWNVTTIKIIITIAILFGFCLPAMTSALLYNKERLKKFAIAGVAINIFAALYFILQVWGLLNINFLSIKNLHLSIIVVILSISSAHISLLLLIYPINDLITKLRLITIIISVIFDLDIIISLIISSSIMPVVIMEILFLLIVVFTILIPLLNKYYQNSGRPKLDKMLEEKKEEKDAE